MGKLLKNKKLLAGIAALVVLAGVIVAAALSLKDKTPKTTPTGAVTATPTPDMTDYKEVRFALPAGTSETDVKNTRLPETLLVPKGTKVSELSRPRQMGKVFLGWYYDEALTLTTLPDETIENNLTLYPRFGDREDLQTQFSYDYISKENVEADYEVIVTGHNVKPETVKEQTKVYNMSLGGEEIEFTLEKIEKAGESDAKEDEEELTEEMKALLHELDIDLDEIDGVPDFYELYDLDEDDSPERYWREELGMDPDQVVAMTGIVRILEKMAWNNATYYKVVPAGGLWPEGQLVQVELADTESIRFKVDDEETEQPITKFNFTIYQEPYNDLAINSGVVFIPLKEVGGIDKLEALYKVSMDDTEQITTNHKSGEFTYKGELEPGTTVAIYDGVLGQNGRVDGEVGYYKITAKNGDGRYTYGTADFTDVLFIPDVIPVADDGTFADGTVKLGAGTLSFSGKQFDHLRNGKNTTIETGDFLYFYTGQAKAVKDLKITGVGRITEVKKDGNGLLVSYEPTTQDKVNNYGMFERTEQIEIPIESIDKDAIMRSMTEQMDRTQFAVKTGDYIVGLINGDIQLPDDPDMAEALKNMTFKTDAGGEMSIEEIRLLGAASKITVSDKTVDFDISGTCEHFHGKGARIVISVGFTITVQLNGNNNLKIQCVAAIEQEIVLGADIDAHIDLLALDETTFDASLRAGTFTGFGAQATVMTTSENPNEDTEWGSLLRSTGAGTAAPGGNSEKLLNMAEKLGNLSEDLEKVQQGGTYTKAKGSAGQFGAKKDSESAQAASAGGDLPTKYAAMLENDDASYIDLLDQKLFKFDFRPPGPFAIIDFSIQGDLVISFKLNAMMGFSISYGNAKQLCYHLEPANDISKTTTTDLETPNFRVDFFVFGMTGLRIGVRLDARIGLLSTDFDSIGVVAEVGLYGEFYGFLYMYYAWTSGKDSESGIMGSLLFEIGAYLEVKFKAQLGDDKLSKEIDIYNKKWPLLQLGDTEVPVPYQNNEEDDEALSKMLEIESGQNTVKVPDAVFNIDMMALDSGEVSRESQDSDKVGAENYSFTINGRTYTQYNEEHFDVVCYDLDGENGKATENHSFQYLSATNEIYIKPVDNDKDEYWGVVIFTYRNDSFGFSTIEFQRILKVHWKGEPCTAVVEYYVHKPGGETNNFDGMGGDRDKYYDFVKEGEFHGFDGIDYDIIVDEDFVYQFPGYRLMGVDYPGIMVADEQYRKASEEYEKEKAKYKEMNAAPDGQYTFSDYKKQSVKVDKALAAVHSNSKYYQSYYTNIGDEVANKQGTMYFRMVKNGTVVRLYYDEVKYKVTVLRVTELPPTKPASDREFFYQGYYDDYKKNADLYIRKDDSVLEKALALMEGYDKTKDLELYYYLPKMADPYARCGAQNGIAKIFIYNHNVNHFKSDGALIREHYSEWMPLTADVKMPDEDLVLIAYEKKSEKEYKVSWVNDYGEAVREDTVVYDKKVSKAPDIGTRKRDGYTSSIEWVNQRGVKYYDGYVMPAEDVTFTARVTYKPVSQPITWNVEGETWVTNGPGTGEPLNISTYNLKYQGSDPNKFKNEDGYVRKRGCTEHINVIFPGNAKLNIPDEEKTYVYGQDKMPYGGVTIKIWFTVNEHKATWMDGDTVVKEEIYPYGTSMWTLHPEVSVGEDEVVDWRTDSYGDKNSMVITMPDRDMVIYTVRHTHTWDAGVVTSGANCMNKGTTKYTCTGCGTTKFVQNLPVDPNNHYRLSEYHVTRANCTSPRIEEYRCLCGYSETRTVGEKDPNYHYMYEATGHYSKQTVEREAPTCAKPGHEEAYYCWDCGALLGGNEEIPATGQHDYVYSTIQDATCEADGEEKGICSVCQGETTRAIPKLGHQWGDVSYELVEGNTKMTAKRTCSRESTHVDTQTVAVTARVVKAASCMSEGTMAYDAQFTNTAFGKKTIEQTIATKAHTWGNVSYTLSTDKRSVKAIRVCAYTLEGVHQEEESAQVSYTVIQPATTTSTGKAKYYATFENPAFAPWEQEVELPIEVCEHVWTDVISKPWAEVQSDKVVLHLGEKTQKCSKCNVKRDGFSEEVKIKPVLKEDTVDFYEMIPYMALQSNLAGYTLRNCYGFGTMITLPTAPDGSGSFSFDISILDEPGIDLDAVKLSDLDAQFQSGAIDKYEIPYTLVPFMSDVPLDGDIYEEMILSNTDDGKPIYGQISYLAENQVTLKLICGHKHEWKTKTEEPSCSYYHQKYHWVHGRTYTSCEQCDMKTSETLIKLQPYVRRPDTNTMFERRSDNTYEIHVKASYLADEMYLWRSINHNEGNLKFYTSSNAVIDDATLSFVLEVYYSEDGSISEDKKYQGLTNNGMNALGTGKPEVTLPDGVTEETMMSELDKAVTIVYSFNYSIEDWETVKIKLVIEP